MNNTQIYPFERNRYYPGRRLLSTDFTAEQTYLNNKQRFLNALMYGNGIVCGLGVFPLDDQSLLVESGAAIDGTGRLIVVDTSEKQKLSAIIGFEELRTNKASLCIRYYEEGTHKANANEPDDPDVEAQCNRVREGYQLFVMDTEELPEAASIETAFLAKDALLANENYLVQFILPATVSRRHLVRAIVEVEKISDADVSLNYFGILQTPTFLSEFGEKHLQIELKDLCLKKGERASFDYWMETLDLPVDTANIVLQAGSAQAFENDRGIKVPTHFSLEIHLSNEAPESLINREIGRISLEMKAIGARGDDFIRLADLELMRTENTYRIENVFENGIKKYLSVPSQDLLRSEYTGFFVKKLAFSDIRQERLVEDDTPETRTSEKSGLEIATGVVEIPLSEEVRKGDIYYSGEIYHGLGEGKVYVDVGYEGISVGDKTYGGGQRTIYGNPEIFARKQRNVVLAETAVCVLNDKGSFEIGARILDDVDAIALMYRWVAIKCPAREEQSGNIYTRGMSISPETPTVRIQTGESHYFGVQFNNMKPMDICYELTESGTGDISADGIYTAPSNPGVYEIFIFCTDLPQICTYAYAIVEKK
ncbi:MAG: hypothetical protein IJ679_04460 [Lachnospiraceae bacterium]|nr:hypothetical protein [Lachnospiraceae bacterium]